MANKPASRNWNDVQIAIATGSMAFTLFFWNLFAGPDRDLALKRAQEQQAARAPVPQPQEQIQPTALPVIEAQPTPMTGPIFFGGSAPQTTIIQNGGRGGGGGGGTGGS